MCMQIRQATLQRISFGSWFVQNTKFHTIDFGIYDLNIFGYLLTFAENFEDFMILLRLQIF